MPQSVNVQVTQHGKLLAGVGVSASVLIGAVRVWAEDTSDAGGIAHLKFLMNSELLQSISPDHPVDARICAVTVGAPVCVAGRAHASDIGKGHVFTLHLETEPRHHHLPAGRKPASR